ncbi:arginase [soil metagenome]
MPTESTRNRLTVAPFCPIVAPLWLGAERPGADLGAPALLDAFRNRWTLDRVGGDQFDRLRDARELQIDVPEDADQRIDQRSLAFQAPILASALRHADLVNGAIEHGELALTLGGDHALGFGSLTGAARASERTGVIWIDTHPDLNTPASSPTGHMHGMPLATAIGVEGRALPELEASAGQAPMIDPSNVVMLGVRDIDPGEADAIRKRGIWNLTMDAWTDTGIIAGLERALHHLEARGVDAVHVSLDFDVLDSSAMPGTGTRWPGGLSFREASQVLRALHGWKGPIRSLDVVELNPVIDPSGFSTLSASLLLATALGAGMMPRP